MEFKTVSGSEYLLTNIEMVVETTGENCPSVGPQGIPVRVSYTGKLSRVGVPLRDLGTGGHFEPSTNEPHVIEFASKPEIGTRFAYWHPVWYGCYSTPVAEINEF